MYCNSQLTARVNYFNKLINKTYKAQSCPINVEIIEEGENANYQLIGSSVTVPISWIEGANVYLLGNRYLDPDTCAIGYKELKVGVATAGKQLTINYTNFSGGCPNAKLAGILNAGYTGGEHQYPSNNLQIGLKRKGTSQYRITITEFNGIVFEDTSTDEIKFTVACGDDCPDGYMSCESDVYPGYKCVPCGEYVGAIQAITSELKRINKPKIPTTTT